MSAVKLAKAVATQEQKLPEVIQVSELSELSQDVLKTFGIETPALLNQYACKVEDALIEAVNKLHDVREELSIVVESYELLRQEFDDYKKANG